MKKKKQGFSAIDHEQHIQIARKGGLTVSQNRIHMAEIGRKGGVNSGKSRLAQKEKRDGLPE